MNWHATPLLGLKTHIDWATPGRLDKVDPYLVWFDLSDFAGAQPGSDDGLKILVEFPAGSGQPPTCETPTLHYSQVEGLLDLVRAEAVSRFELATPMIVGNATGGPPGGGANLPGQIGGAQRRPSDQPTIVAFIDYGCAFAHRQFRPWQGGTPRPGTRVLALWDQGASADDTHHGGARLPLAWQCPADFGYGLETLRDLASGDDRGRRLPGLQLNDYIAQFKRPDGSIDEARCYAQSGHHAATRPVTHGTHMMDTATGFPGPLADLPAEKQHTDKPHQADIVFVQLPRWVRGRQVGGMLRAHLLDALHYILSLARPATRVVVNLSYGTYAGSHDGSSILEQAIDRLIAERSGPGKLNVVVAAGNAYDKALHAHATLDRHGEACFAWHNLPDDPSDSFVELWLPAQAQNIEVRVRAPGMSPGMGDWLQPGAAATLRRNDGSLLAALVYVQQACQSHGRAMVLLAVAPTVAGTARRPAPYGVWQIEVRNRGAAQVVVQAWCERDDLGYGGEPWPRQGYFSDPSGGKADSRYAKVRTDNTLSSLAQGQHTTVVGAVVLSGPVAAYSSTGEVVGPDERQVQSKGKARRRPDVLAPAEEHPGLPGLAAAAMVGGETVRLNGTSVAAAYVTRLMLENRFPLAKGPPPPPQGPPLSAHPDETGVRRVP